MRKTTFHSQLATSAVSLSIPAILTNLNIRSFFQKEESLAGKCSLAMSGVLNLKSLLATYWVYDNRPVTFSSLESKKGNMASGIVGSVTHSLGQCLVYRKLVIK